jgi:hypothetical protein
VSEPRRYPLTPLQAAHLGAVSLEVQRLELEARRLQREAVGLVAAEHGATAEDTASIEQGEGGPALVLTRAEGA